ncbi:hypothetical protein B0H13DRAFT_2321827 [Mycena leptocephala]|nr:hypothetical protein B0H13DRAFT_2321827 [Mycena leptocephala]
MSQTRRLRHEDQEVEARTRPATPLVLLHGRRNAIPLLQRIHAATPLLLRSCPPIRLMAAMGTGLTSRGIRTGMEAVRRVEAAVVDKDLVDQLDLEGLQVRKELPVCQVLQEEEAEGLELERLIQTSQTRCTERQSPPSTQDGNHDTAIQYFAEVSQKAALEGHIPRALGFWLGMRLEAGSPVQEWYIGLPGAQQALMRQHYILYLQAIKDLYLGRTWQRKMNRVYEMQRFRQRGHENETPQKYLGRRILYTRMLVDTDNGGPGEVYHILDKVPVSWGPILVVENIPNTMVLYAKVVEHEQALVNAARNESAGVRPITADNLGATLKALGYSVDRQRPNARQAHLTFQAQEEATLDVAETDPVEDLEESNEDVVLKLVYVTLKEQRRGPPPGGYPFPKNDHVVTKLGKLPPSPCRLCGSEKHWSCECPNYVLYSEGVKRNAKLAAKNEPTEEELMYQNVFSVLLNQSLSSSAIDFSKLESSCFELAASMTHVRKRKTASPPVEDGVPLQRVDLECKNLPVTTISDYAPAGNPHIHGSFETDTSSDIERTRSFNPRRNPAATIVEEEDEEDLAYAAKPKAESSLMEETNQVEDEPEAETPRAVAVIYSLNPLDLARMSFAYTPGASQVLARSRN